MIGSSFARDIKWLGLAQIFLRLKGFLIIPLMTHALGARDYGIWTQCVAVGSLFLPFVIWGMNNGFIRYASGKTQQEQLSLLTAWFLFLSALTAAITLPVFVFREELSDVLLGGVDDGKNLLYFSIGFCFVGALFQAYTTWLKSSGQSGLYSVVLVFQSVSSLAAILIYIFVTGSLVFLVSLTLFFEFLFVFSLIIYNFANYGWHAPDFEKIKIVFRFSYPLMPLTFAYLGIGWGDRLVLLDNLTISEVGVYNLSHGVALMLVQSIAQPVWTYYPPRFTCLYEEGDKEGIQRLYCLSAGTFITFIIPAIIGLAVLSPTLIGVLAPDVFKQGGAALVLLFSGYSVNILSGYYDQYLQVQFRQKLIVLSLLICFFLNICLNLLLVPVLGLTGAGVASLLAFSFRFLFVYFLVRKTISIRVSLSYLVRISLCAICMGAAVFFAQRLILSDLIPELQLIIASSFGGTIFFMLAFVFKAVKLSELKEFKDVLFNR